MTNIIPNTTQIPHLIIREWMPRLKDVELRVLLIVADQTLGWIEDKETGRRKERDWISRGQLMRKAGRGHSAVSKAIKILAETHRIIEAFNEGGDLLDTPEKRQKCGDRIFYRLNLYSPPMTLFDTCPKSGQVSRKKATEKNLRKVSTFQPPQKVDTTKETVLTKVNLKTSKLDSDIKKLGNSGTFKNENDTNGTAKKLPTNKLISAFYQYCQAVRGAKAVFTKFKDGNLIKHALKHLSETQIEQLFMWFLAEKKEMRPTIGAALCKEVIADFLKQESREYGFYGKIDGYFQRYLKKETKTAESEGKAIVGALKKLYSSFGIGIPPSERARMAEETAAQERAWR